MDVIGLVGVGDSTKLRNLDIAVVIQGTRLDLIRGVCVSGRIERNEF